MDERLTINTFYEGIESHHILRISIEEAKVKSNRVRCPSCHLVHIGRFVSD